MIYLAQTDTTAGFLSKNLLALNTLKNRPASQPCLLTTTKFSELTKLTRVPPRHKNFVRKSKKTTFLYPNKKAIRVIKDCTHAKFLADFDWLYSTSANLHNMKFDENWARKVADVVVDDTLFEGQSSKIFKISRAKIKKIR